MRESRSRLGRAFLSRPLVRAERSAVPSQLSGAALMPVPVLRAEALQISAPC